MKFQKSLNFSRLLTLCCICYCNLYVAVSIRKGEKRIFTAVKNECISIKITGSILHAA